MTLPRIALPLMGVLTLGALPASAGMLTFTGSDDDVSTTASSTEGGLTTIAVCGYTYARFGASGEGWQRVDVAQLARDLGLGNGSSNANASGRNQGGNGSGGDNSFGSAGGTGSYGNHGSQGSRGLFDGFDSEWMAAWARNHSSTLNDNWGSGGRGFPAPPIPWLNGPWHNNPGFPWHNGGDGGNHGEDSDTQHAPEPATLLLLGGGLLASRMFRRRKQQS
jgi:hypothetical protein